MPRLRTVVSSVGTPSGPIVRVVRLSCIEPSSLVVIDIEVEVDVKLPFTRSLEPGPINPKPGRPMTDPRSSRLGCSQRKKFPLKFRL